ncbi:hypothetical protein MVLG_01958 [Microbotryum lychnidis-dioicae p1A1 Lamole]|uniref:Dolichyl-diphosphooligosaccharide--protein glycosyltransferase subunit 2 n=1 Tax=Microbotryum lychnidis-dioicae (strain p1A1 Lamole / MvSl-1064) TaxID=683840 RepID=U5H3P7_USTV1|nr:hypothetical protein MVLG_01958 [Microbotryum lychnidis-dioicae p1A1 Lamole]|eukprot:KDE07864.1 hypothetical protein MVLG_01958 [Microbotryum lychnidis-dioicae p1A1 Lamole]
MLFKLPTFALTLALLSAQIQARGPSRLTNVGTLVFPSQGQIVQVGDLLPLEYQLDVAAPGPAYKFQLQHLDGREISTFATGIVADNSTATIAAQFLVPRPNNMTHKSDPIDAILAVLQYAPVEDTKHRFSYQVVQQVTLTITNKPNKP